jgi:hypothetical protein
MARAQSLDLNPKRPEDALAEFLGMDDSQGTGFVNLDAAPYRDPSLELASLRGTRESELKNRVAKGDTSNHAPDFLAMLQKDEALDPYTGIAERKKADANRDAATATAEYNEPSNPVGQGMRHAEAFELQKQIAAHPSTTGAPGQSLSVPGGLPVGGPGGAPQIDDTIENLAKAMLNYTADVPTGNAAARYPFVQAAARARQLDPSFNMGEYGRRNAVLKRYQAGPTADRINALNQAVGHLSQLDESIPGLDNAEGPLGYMYNTAGNFFQGHSNPKIAAFEGPRGYYAEEAGKFFHGNPSEQAAKIGRDVFDRDAAPSFLKQSVGSQANMLATGAKQLEDSLKADLGLPVDQPLPDRWKQLLYHEGTSDLLTRLIGGAPNPPERHDVQNPPPATPGTGVTVRRIQ